MDANRQGRLDNHDCLEELNQFNLQNQTDLVDETFKECENFDEIVVDGTLSHIDVDSYDGSRGGQAARNNTVESNLSPANQNSAQDSQVQGGTISEKD